MADAPWISLNSYASSLTLNQASWKQNESKHIKKIIPSFIETISPPQSAGMKYDYA